MVMAFNQQAPSRRERDREKRIHLRRQPPHESGHTRDARHGNDGCYECREDDADVRVC
jgi:hypothetical protein